MNATEKSIVVPLEDGGNPDWAVGHVIELYRQQPVDVYLLNVRQPLPQYVSRFIAAKELKAFHRENGMRVIKPAADRLDACGIPHQDHVLIGQKAASIVKFAREQHCSQIILPKPSGGPLAGLMLGSVGGQIRHLIGAAGTCAICEVY
jgi:nucleotide-binding universal stress UspA family protein